MDVQSTKARFRILRHIFEGKGDAKQSEITSLVRDPEVRVPQLGYLQEKGMIQQHKKINSGRGPNEITCWTITPKGNEEYERLKQVCL